jgi:hypothetical protein
LSLPLKNRYCNKFVLLSEQTQPKLPKSSWRQLAHLLYTKEVGSSGQRSLSPLLTARQIYGTLRDGTGKGMPRIEMR